MTLGLGIKRFSTFPALTVGSVLLGLYGACGISSAYSFQRIQQTIEAGAEIYQGSDASVFRPPVSVRAAIATRYDIQDWFALVGRMTGQFFLSPTPGFNTLPDSTYFGFGVGYNPCLRLKLGVEGLVPYIEGGGIISFNFLGLQNAPANVSSNQLALKFGYTAGLGIDWFADSSSGHGGFGLGLTYFVIASGPALLDYASGPIGGAGIRADIHINLSL